MRTIHRYNASNILEATLVGIASQALRLLSIGGLDVEHTPKDGNNPRGSPNCIRATYYEVRSYARWEGLNSSTFAGIYGLVAATSDIWHWALNLSLTPSSGHRATEIPHVTRNRLLLTAKGTTYYRARGSWTDMKNLHGDGLGVHANFSRCTRSAVSTGFVSRRQFFFASGVPQTGSQRNIFFFFFFFFFASLSGSKSAIHC